MFLGKLSLTAVAFLVSATGVARDQDRLAEPVAAGAVDLSGPSARKAENLVVPALTPLIIRLETDLGSQLSKTGDRFALSLAEPVIVDGLTLLPAGLKGEGEVVHAKKSGGSGTGGELVLAARWLEIDGRRLRLRSLRLNSVGKDAIQKIDGFNAAMAASPVPIGVIGFFIKGKNAVHAKGELAEAKTAESFPINNTPDTDEVNSMSAVQVQREDLK